MFWVRSTPKRHPELLVITGLSTRVCGVRTSPLLSRNGLISKAFDQILIASRPRLWYSSRRSAHVHESGLVRLVGRLWHGGSLSVRGAIPVGFRQLNARPGAPHRLVRHHQWQAPAARKTHIGKLMISTLLACYPIIDYN